MRFANRIATAIGAGACVAAIGAPAAIAQAAPRIVADATFPGVPVAQTVTYEPGWITGAPDLRVDARPAADTVVVTAFAMRYRPGRTVGVRGAACVRFRMRASLHPDPIEPVALAERLLPRADVMSYVADTRTRDALGPGVPAAIERRRPLTGP